MIHRRAFLRGLVATPAVVAAGSLMPVRGIIVDWRDPYIIVCENLRDVLMPGLRDIFASKYSASLFEHSGSLLIGFNKPVNCTR